MRKRPNKDNQADSMIRSLKKLKTSDSDKNLLKSAHQLLSLQLKAIREFTRAPNKPKGIIFYDSRILPLPDGVRPAAVETARLKFQIEDKQLQISLYPVSTERFEIVGQLSGIESGKVLGVNLKRGGKQIKTKTNEFQVFRLENVQKAKYELEINDYDVTVANVVLDI